MKATFSDPRVKSEYEESPEEKNKWKAFRQFVRKETNGIEDKKFTVAGYIKSLTGDPENPDQPRINIPKEGSGFKPRAVLDAIVASTDPRFPGLEWKKAVGFSFFDGKLKNGTTSPNKGGMYGIHNAVTGNPPSQALINGKGEFDPTDDYCGADKPVMLRLIFKGQVEEEGQYYGRRGNLTVFLDGFEPHPDKMAAAWGDDDEEEPDGMEVNPLVASSHAGDDEKEPWDE